VYSRRRESHIKYPGPDDDVRENIINYDDEGGGEDDMTAFDITPLQIPIGGTMPELTQCKMPPLMCKLNKKSKLQNLNDVKLKYFLPYFSETFRESWFNENKPQLFVKIFRGILNYHHSMKFDFKLNITSNKKKNFYQTQYKVFVTNIRVENPIHILWKIWQKFLRGNLNVKLWSHWTPCGMAHAHAETQHIRYGDETLI
jgi:hypothetical protein